MGCMMAAAGWGSGEGGGLCAEMGPRKEGNVVLAVAAVCVCVRSTGFGEGRGPGVCAYSKQEKHKRRERGRGEGGGLCAEMVTGLCAEMGSRKEGNVVFAVAAVCDPRVYVYVCASTRLPERGHMTTMGPRNIGHI